MTNLDIILLVNQITWKELYTKLGMKRAGPIARINSYSSENTSIHYSILVELKKAGLLIPYHLRPKCGRCAARFCPSTKQQKVCAYCGRGEGTEELTLSDAIELGIPPQRIKTLLGIPDNLFNEMLEKELEHIIVE